MRYTFLALSPYLVTTSCKLFHGTFCPCNQQAPNRKLARAIILCPWCPHKYVCSPKIETLSYISCGLLTSVHCLVSDVRRDGRLYYCDQGETVSGGADPTLANSASHSFSTINITGGPLYTQLHAWKVRFITAEKQTTNTRGVSGNFDNNSTLASTLQTLEEPCGLFFRSASQFDHLMFPRSHCLKPQFTMVLFLVPTPIFPWPTKNFMRSDCISRCAGKAENCDFYYRHASVTTHDVSRHRNIT